MVRSKRPSDCQIEVRLAWFHVRAEGRLAVIMAAVLAAAWLALSHLSGSDDPTALVLDRLQSESADYPR